MAQLDRPNEDPDETLKCLLEACGVEETPEELRARYADIYEDGESALAKHLAAETEVIRAQAQRILDEQES